MAVAGILLLSLTCCRPSASGRKPTGKGMPSEVAVVGDARRIVERVLTLPVEGLPQPEPQFRVTRIDRCQEAVRLFSNVVVVNVNPKAYTRTQIHCIRDRYVWPQVIIQVNTPSLQTLEGDAGRLPLLSLLLANERRRNTALLQRHHTLLAQADARHLSCSLLVPPGMTVNKRGDRFLWLSDNAAPAMGNICLYRADNRDSVMRQNLKGETDRMYMTTVWSTVHTVKGPVRRGLSLTVRRGLWQMEGDAMGGPFVQHVVTSRTGQTWVAEAFLYAPGQDKRDKMRMLEAALYTLKPVPAQH